MNETTKTLCHEWSKAKKAAYNREYYNKNKWYWQEWSKTNQQMNDSARKATDTWNAMKGKGSDTNASDAYQHWKKHKENRDLYKKSQDFAKAGAAMYRGYDPDAAAKAKKKQWLYSGKVAKGTASASEIQEYYKAKKKYKDAQETRHAIERTDSYIKKAQEAEKSSSTQAGRDALKRMMALAKL